MFVSEKLVFVELHKTGCTHIRRLLQQTTAGSIVGKHNIPSRKLIDTSRFFLGSIRNPWEWYVSLWAYGCDKRGSIYHQVTRSDTMLDACRNWLVDPLYSASLLLERVSRSPELWRRCYGDVDDPAAFRRWLYLVHDRRHWHDLGESYGKYPMSSLAGLLTYRYLKLFCRRDFRGIRTLDQLQAFERSHCYIDYFIRNESLERDFLVALDRAGIVLSEDDKNRINSTERTNTSSKKYSAASYYDAQTIDLVGRRERLIIDKFGYEPPALQGAAMVADAERVAPLVKA